MPGYWNEDETSINVVRCATPAEERCLGYNVQNMTCLCGEGYTGNACRQCVPGFFVNRDLRCALCPKQHSVYDLVVLPSMILVGLVLITIMSLTALTLMVALIGVRSIDPLYHTKVVCRGSYVMAELKLALKNSSLFAVGLAGVVQIVASVCLLYTSPSPRDRG